MLCLLPGPATAADAGYLRELQAAAGEMRLWESTAWQRLLHLTPAAFGAGVQSTVDFRGFFLAPAGKTDPQAELSATLAAFFDDALLYDEPRQCRFKARYEWLKTQLGFDPARLPETPCVRLSEWSESLNVGNLTLVFASNDLSSPSSMFGHTLLRLDAQGAAGDQRLLGYAVNYAAQTTQDASFLYAVKGLTGFYQGTFSVMPYYDKVREYERFEHRDLWEYPLHLDAEARQRVLWHLWEMRGVHSDYFFFGENCSYQLLSLVEAAVPEMDLTASFRAGPDYTIPVDSVRKLRAAGVLGEPVFRPANAHRLLHRYSQLTEAGQAWTRAYARGTAGLEDPMYVNATAEEQANWLEVAHDAIYFGFQKGEANRDVALPRARALLSARSRNPARSDFSEVPRPVVSPDLGHGSGRLAAGVRMSAGDGEEAMALIGWRPAYHDRLDPAPGYLAGGEIEFLRIDLAANDRSLRLDYARIVNVQAVAARDDLFKPWSWFATLDARRLRPLAQEDPGSLGAGLSGGGGMAWTPLAGAQFFGFAVADVQINRDLKRDQNIGSGMRLGLAVQRLAPLSLELTAEALGGVAGAHADRARLDLAAQWSFGVRDGLRLAYRVDRQSSDDFDWRDEAVELRWLHYY